MSSKTSHRRNARCQAKKLDRDALIAAMQQRNLEMLSAHENKAVTK